MTESGFGFPISFNENNKTMIQIKKTVKYESIIFHWLLAAKCVLILVKSNSNVWCWFSSNYENLEVANIINKWHINGF